MKYVVNSTNENMTYAFFMPIICRMWKRRGYEPIAIMLGAESEWRSDPWRSYVYDNTKANSRIYHINRVNGVHDFMVVQSSRLFVSALADLRPSDYLLTSDVDTLPLSNDWFHQQGGEFQVFGADAYLHQRFPICYLGGLINVWRRIMGIRDMDIQRAIIGGLNENFNGWSDNMLWRHDEVMFYRKIRSSPIFNSIKRINRGRSGGVINNRFVNRLDRAYWDWHGQKDLIDCHSYRPGYDPNHWLSIKLVLKAYSSPEDFDYFCSYKAWFETH